MKKVSIIIVTYNSMELINGCIDSIYKFNDIGELNTEIIIVDNSSETESKKMFDMLRELYDGKLKLIWNDKNLGYGQGNNVGIDNSTGDFICIMNPDVRFTEPILLTVQKEFNSNPNLGMLGFKQIGGANLSYYLKPEFYLSILNSIVIKGMNRFNIFSQKYFYLSGAFLFLDKMKFKEIGKFDHKIFLYSEEPDISNRLRKAGYQIKFSNAHSYLHLIGDRTAWSDKGQQIWLDSKKYYFNKFHFNERKYWKLKSLDYKIKFYIAIVLGNRKRKDFSLNQLRALKAYLR